MELHPAHMYLDKTNCTNYTGDILKRHDEAHVMYVLHNGVMPHTASIKLRAGSAADPALKSPRNSIAESAQKGSSFLTVVEKVISAETTARASHLIR